MVICVYFVLNVQVQKQRAQSRYLIVVPCMWGVFNEVKEHVTFSLKYNECNVCAVLSRHQPYSVLFLSRIDLCL